MKLNLRLLPDVYAVCKLANFADAPAPAISGDALYSVSVTQDEVSLLCTEEMVKNMAKPVKIETNWRAFVVQGPLDFSMVGVLARISDVLAAQSISIFVVSTFDTDVVLVKDDMCKAAIAAFAKTDDIFLLSSK